MQSVQSLDEKKMNICLANDFRAVQINFLNRNRVETWSDERNAKRIGIRTNFFAERLKNFLQADNSKVLKFDAWNTGVILEPQTVYKNCTRLARLSTICFEITFFGDRKQNFGSW